MLCLTYIYVIFYTDVIFIVSRPEDTYFVSERRRLLNFNQNIGFRIFQNSLNSQDFLIVSKIAAVKDGER